MTSRNHSSYRILIALLIAIIGVQSYYLIFDKSRPQQIIKTADVDEQPAASVSSINEPDKIETIEKQADESDAQELLSPANSIRIESEDNKPIVFEDARDKEYIKIPYKTDVENRLAIRYEGDDSISLTPSEIFNGSREDVMEIISELQTITDQLAVDNHYKYLEHVETELSEPKNSNFILDGVGCGVDVCAVSVTIHDNSFVMDRETSILKPDSLDSKAVAMRSWRDPESGTTTIAYIFSTGDKPAGILHPTKI